MEPINNSFTKKRLDLSKSDNIIKIGRKVSVKNAPDASNGIFDSKVLSRNHAEVWSDEEGRVWIKDVKSSNGTFVNGVRLSEEGQQSAPAEIVSGDLIEFGIDILNEDGCTSNIFLHFNTPL